MSALEIEEAPADVIAKLTTAEMRAKLAEMSEERWERRHPRIMQDPYLDDRVKEIYLRRNRIGYRQMAEILGLGPDRISKLRRSPETFLDETHTTPAKLPLPDDVDRRAQLTEEGVFVEWAVQAHLLIWDPKKNKHVPTAVPLRHGRARSQRSTVGRPYEGGGRDPRYVRRKKTKPTKETDE